MHSAVIITILIVILAVSFDFINGFHDTATSVATSISTKALTPAKAIILCAICNFIGAFMSTKVAETVGNSIVSYSKVPTWEILAVLAAAIIWNLFTWYYGIPSSSSHALIGAIIGGAMVYNMSVSVVNWDKLLHSVVLWLFISPIIGFGVGYLLMKILRGILKPFKLKVINRVFLKLQILSAAAMAFNHGANDAQKSMGIITMALLSGGFISAFVVPKWVIIICALAMALGTSIGGKRIIKTMGRGMVKLTPVDGFAAQTGAAAVIFLATTFKAPVSTTHIITTDIMGVGSSKRFKAVNWGVAKSIVWTWILTIPATGILSGLIVAIVKLFI